MWDTWLCQCGTRSCRHLRPRLDAPGALASCSLYHCNNTNTSIIVNTTTWMCFQHQIKFFFGENGVRKESKLAFWFSKVVRLVYSSKYLSTSWKPYAVTQIWDFKFKKKIFKHSSPCWLSINNQSLTPSTHTFFLEENTQHVQVIQWKQWFNSKWRQSDNVLYVSI